MKNDKEREIFRYSDESENFIGLVSDIKEELDGFFPTKKNPFRNVKSPILWITIKRTNRSAKKDPRYKTLEDDAYCGQGSESKIKQAWDIVKLVSNWIEKETPDFLAISAHGDSSYKKRFHFYNRFLIKRNYKLFYVDYSNYEKTLAVYAKDGLDLKYPNISIDLDRI